MQEKEEAKKGKGKVKRRSQVRVKTTPLHPPVPRPKIREGKTYLLNDSSLSDDGSGSSDLLDGLSELSRSCDDLLDGSGRGGGLDLDGSGGGGGNGFGDGGHSEGGGENLLKEKEGWREEES